MDSKLEIINKLTKEYQEKLFEDLFKKFIPIRLDRMKPFEF